jgi:flagellar protein FliO/FliZ
VAALPGLAWAQQAARPAVEAPSMMPMFAALAVVLGILGAAVWVLRRAGVVPRAAGLPMRVLGQLALGPRERVVLIEVAGRGWLLGVGAGGVSRLGCLTLPPQAADSPGAPLAPSPFPALLERLRKRVG